MPLPEDLSLEEQDVLAKAQAGEVASFGAPTPEQLADPAFVAAMPVVRAAVIRVLCLGEWEDVRVHAKGIAIAGVRISKPLNFEFATLLSPLILYQCWLGDEVILRNTTAKLIIFSGSHLVKGFSADEAAIQGSVFLREGFTAKGQIRLPMATIGGHLDLSGARLDSPDGRALLADGVKVTGSVMLREGFTAKGAVRLPMATIGGHLDLSGAKLDSPDGRALLADGVKVTGSVVLREGFTAKGQVRLPMATIGGSLDLNGARLENPAGDALLADGVKVTGSVVLRNGFTAKGQVRLPGASLGTNLELNGARLEAPLGDALIADSANIKQNVSLADRFIAKGAVRLLMATIGGSLDLNGARLENPVGDALLADGVKVTGSVVLRNGFTAKGQVRLPGASLGGSLDLSGARLENPAGDALLADGVKVTGSVVLRNGFTAKGQVRLPGASLGGHLDLSGARLENPAGDALLADGVKVTGSVVLREGFTAKGAVCLPGASLGDSLLIKNAIFENRTGSQPAVLFANATIGDLLRLKETRIIGPMNLDHCRVRQLDDDEDSWPAMGEVELNGFVYESFGQNAPCTAKKRLAWLRLQRREKRFQPQPYEQVIRVFRAMGYDAEARKVAIAKQRDRRKYGRLGVWGWLTNGFLGATVGYGYRPWLGLIWLAALIGCGWFVFHNANRAGAMVPTAPAIYLENASQPHPSPWPPREYPVFSPLVYSMQLAIPVINLRQTQAWVPISPHGKWPQHWWHEWSVIAYLWFYLETFFGWILTTVIVVALTGILRKD